MSSTQNADLINRMEINETRISFLEQQNYESEARIVALLNRIEKLESSYRVTASLSTFATQKKN